MSDTLGLWSMHATNDLLTLTRACGGDAHFPHAGNGSPIQKPKCDQVCSDIIVSLMEPSLNTIGSSAKVAQQSAALVPILSIINLV